MENIEVRCRSVQILGCSLFLFRLCVDVLYKVSATHFRALLRVGGVCEAGFFSIIDFNLSRRFQQGIPRTNWSTHFHFYLVSEQNTFSHAAGAQWDAETVPTRHFKPKSVHALPFLKSEQKRDFIPTEIFIEDYTWGHIVTHTIGGAGVCQQSCMLGTFFL